MMAILFDACGYDVKEGYMTAAITFVIESSTTPSGLLRKLYLTTQCEECKECKEYTKSFRYLNPSVIVRVIECWMFYAVLTARLIFTVKTSLDIFSPS